MSRGATFMLRSFQRMEKRPTELKEPTLIKNHTEKLQ
jgi:hypothetical protein